MAKKKLKSKYELTKGTKISVSKTPAEDTTVADAEFVELGFTAKELSYTAGQKTDIDVTTLASDEQEAINGLPSSGEFSISGHWVGDDEGQEILREAYENDTQHAFKTVFLSGNGYTFLAEVRQNSWSVSPNGVVTGSFGLRVKGGMTKISKPAPPSQKQTQGA